MPVIERRIAEAKPDTEGRRYLFAAGVEPGCKDRAGAFSKQFARLRVRLGLDERQPFYSFRKTFLLNLKDAGIIEALAADIVGHAHRSLSYGTYAGRASTARLHEAMQGTIKLVDLDATPPADS